MLTIEIFTLFPNLFEAPLRESILGRAIARGLLSVGVHNIRDAATDRHQVTDDAPYGGGGGMVMKPEPIFASVEAVLGSPPALPVILLTPQGDAVHAAEGLGARGDSGVRACLRPVRRGGRARARASGERGAVHRRLRAFRRRAGGAGGGGSRRAPSARRARRRRGSPRRQPFERVAGISALHPPARVPRLGRAGGPALGQPCPVAAAGAASSRCGALSFAAPICWRERNYPTRKSG